MMTLAAILVVYCVSLGCSPRGVLGFAMQTAGQQPPGVTGSNSPTPASQESTPQSQPAPPAQSPDSTQSVPSPTGQTQNPAGSAKPSPTKPHRHHKKASASDCSISPTALSPAAGGSAASTNTDSASTGAANTGANDVGATPAGSSNPAAAPSKPCPPPKVVVRNGGAEEPTVQLKGGTAEEESHQRSTTDQLATATEANLKKIEGRQLNPSQQDMVSQIKQFMEQSKAAVAAGDSERGHNLALKAHLLSDELVKP